MDAASYLKRQGWRGEGHALSHTGNGIKKPLLVSKKVDVLGVGLNKHAAVSDQWWMRAFDQGLKDLGTGKKTVLATVRDKGVNYGGLYGRFVKGESVPGTFSEDSTSADTSADEENMAAKEVGISAKAEGKKRKRDMEDIREVKKQRKLDKAAKSKVEKDRSGESSVSRQKKDLDKKTKGFVHEAVSRGLIPAKGSDSAPKSGGSKSVVEKYGEEAVSGVMQKAGIDDPTSSKGSGKQAKYDSGKLRRAVERAARAYLLEQLPAHEREQIEADDEREVQQKKKRKRDERMEKDDAAAAKAAEKEAKRLRKKQKSEKKLEKSKDGSKMGVDSVPKKDDLAMGTDEVKLDAATTKPEKKSKKSKVTTSRTNTTPETLPDGVGFVIDTVGDATLPESDVTEKSIVLVDNDGNIRRTFQPGESIPLDPALWGGISAKILPRPVRNARKQWMAQQREAKKAHKGTTDKISNVAEAKSKGQKKIERREKLVTQILIKSRQANRDGSNVTTVEIDGHGNVSVVHVESKNGPFNKEEMALARSVARKVLKEEKKEKESKEKKTAKKKT